MPALVWPDVLAAPNGDTAVAAAARPERFQDLSIPLLMKRRRVDKDDEAIDQPANEERLSMTHSDHDGGLTRRSLLAKAIGLSAAATLAVTAVSAPPAYAWTGPLQYPWKYCRWCAGMVYTAWFNQGCPAGSAHWPIGWTFQLPYNGTGNATGTPHDQKDWRHCGTCLTLYFEGYNPDGVCHGNPGGPHTHLGLNGGNNFILPFDLTDTAGTQTDWRFCNKCYILFFNGSPFKGVCAAGGAHFAAGYNFAIPIYSY